MSPIYVADAIYDEGSMKQEDKGEFGIFAENELQNMSYAELLSHELEHMKFNAFKVCDELTRRKSELFINNDEYLKKYTGAFPRKKPSIPSGNYFLWVLLCFCVQYTHQGQSEEQNIVDQQPQVQLKRVKLDTEENVQKFCNTYIV